MEQEAEADRGGYRGFPCFNVIAGGPGQLALALCSSCCVYQMAKPSIQADFLKGLRAAWATALSSVRPVDAATCGAFPKARTFYAGVAPPSGLHVYVQLSFSGKSWQAGQFQVAFVLSKQLGGPEQWALPRVPDDPSGFTEGCYYLIHEFNGKHWLGKVWHLAQTEASANTAPWFASSYGDRAVVFAEAITDVTREVTRALRRVGIIVDSRLNSDGA